MKYIFDIDGTICSITDGRYEEAMPYVGIIQNINRLYDEGHTIIFYTARGMGRSHDNHVKAERIFRGKTEGQLALWGVKYHQLLFGKPSADYYVDDKHISIGNICHQYPIGDRDIHLKGWGWENWIVNNELYCGKQLKFYSGKKCSWHYHKIKDETFYVGYGVFTVLTGEDDNIEEAKRITLKEGDSLHIPPGLRHQMIARTDAMLWEFSTQHFEEDSYRIIKGD